MKFKTKYLMSFLIVFGLILAGCGSNETDTTEPEEDDVDVTEEEEDSELKVAISAQPPTLDQHMSSSTATQDVAKLLYETLVTYNSDYEPVPMLAESFEESDDGKTYTFNLREGVMFHNGKEMVADDVVASMERWVELSGLTGSIFDDATFEAEDDYTFKIELASPSALTLDTIASPKQAPAIMPAEVIEGASAEGVDEYIGTGPYKFVEWKDDQNIHLTKYDDYSALEEEPDGLAGKKEALIKDIYFHIVPDATTQLTGLQTGEYDIAIELPSDLYDQIENSDNLEGYFHPLGEAMLFYNKVEGPASDFKMREAINAALDVDEIMQGVFVKEDLYWLDPSYMNKNITKWQSDAGEQFYNQKDPEKAKEILDEIGYDGEEIRILTTRDYSSMYDAAIIIQEQLNQVGLNVTLDVYDWPTYSDRLDDPESWELSFTVASMVATPTQLISLSPSYAGGVQSDEISDQLKAIENATDEAEAIELWEELQGFAWESHLPVTVLGGQNIMDGVSDSVEGLEHFFGIVLWNVDKK